MEEKFKEIISVFTKIPVEQIGPATAIDRSVLQSSILLHRMYARLQQEGLTVTNYVEIRTYSDLLRQGAGSDSGLTANEIGGILASPDGAGTTASTYRGNGIHTPAAHSAGTTPAYHSAGMDTAQAGVGIDLEEVAGLPRTHDFRKEEFYKMNFTAGEIAYCILQPDPYASFTGLFAAKEAIIKADGRYRNKRFNEIEIGHSAEGKPLFPGLELSISHAGTMAVAVAASAAGSGTPVLTTPLSAGPARAASGKSGLILGLATLALLLSGIALVLIFIHWHE